MYGFHLSGAAYALGAASPGPQCPLPGINTTPPPGHRFSTGHAILCPDCVPAFDSDPDRALKTARGPVVTGGSAGFEGLPVPGGSTTGLSGPGGMAGGLSGSGGITGGLSGPGGFDGGVFGFGVDSAGPVAGLPTVRVVLPLMQICLIFRKCAPCCCVQAFLMNASIHPDTSESAGVRH